MATILDNPILDSYIKGIQLRRQNEQTQFENQLQTEQGDRAKLQLEGYLKNLDSEQKHRQAQLDLQQNQLQLERATHELNARKMLADMTSSGQYHPLSAGEQNSSPVGGNINIPGLNPIDPRQFSTPEQMQARDINYRRALGDVSAETAGKTTTATYSAASPFERLQAMNKFQQEKELALLKSQEEMKQVTAHVEGSKAVARIHGQYELDNTRLKDNFGQDLTPDDWAARLLPFAVGDAQKTLGNNPKDLVTRQHLNNLGYVEFPAKKKDELAKTHIIDPVFNLMQEFIDQAPKQKTAAGTELLISKIPATDLKDFKDRVRSMGGSLASQLDAQTGRMANQEIDRVLGGLAVPGKTYEQAVKDITLLKARYSAKAVDSIMSGVPEKQRVLILKKNGFDLDNFTTSYKGQDVKRYKTAPDGSSYVFDPKSGVYVNPDGR